MGPALQTICPIYVSSIATSILRHVGASRLSSTYLSTFTRDMTGGLCMVVREANPSKEGNIKEIKQY